MNLHKIAAVIVIVLFTALAISNVNDNQNKLHLKEIQLKSRAAELKSLELKYDSLQVELNHTDNLNKEQIKKLEEEKHKLEQERQRLEKELAIKKASKLQTAANTPLAPQTAYASPGGSCASWMAQAGIPNTIATNKLIGGESGCRPNAINPSSGACGIPQALPCSKMGCSLSDAVCQLRWMDNYVKVRYGSWDNAYGTWLSRSPHWY